MWPQLDIKIECIRKNKYVRYIEKFKPGGLLISFLLIDLISHIEKSVNQFKSCVVDAKETKNKLTRKWINVDKR